MLRRIVGTTATTLLVVAAVALASWFVFSHLTGATLITFRTGSMSPTMPQGTLAVTLPVTADELEVGDVVTVRRAGGRLPVTHRIIDISKPQQREPHAADIRAAAPDAADPPDPADPRTREIVMQGDANATPDSLPYLVTDTRKVVFFMPVAGNAVMLLQTPIGMGGLILVVGAFTTWAFWPRSSGKGTADEMAELHEGGDPNASRGDRMRHGEEVRR